jgi:DNA polymerase-3 subunit gamma/tau
VPQGNLAVSNGHLATRVRIRARRVTTESATLSCQLQNMSYLVIARKWRPQNFADIAGQEPITRTLQNAIRTNRIAHAYLFTGVRGVGKTTAARILAKALNCENGPTATPCNQCSHCEEITQGVSIDVLEIDGASNRGIDEIRQIIENVRYQPAKCRFKIYIIDEVHQVTKDAFNALLKTLEEPPPSVKFILATTEPHRLPETILSRCQRYDFRRISLREIVQRLGEIARSEGLGISDGALALIGREADGSMRDAQSLLEQVLACSQPATDATAVTTVDETVLQDILGLAQRRVLYDLSAAVIAADAQRCIELIGEVVHQGRDLNRLSRDLVEHFRNLLVARLSGQPRTGASSQDGSGFAAGHLLDLPDQEIADLGNQVRDVTVELLLDYFDFMAAGDEEITRSATPRFALESALIRLATLPKTLPVAELIERLERLEGKFLGTVKPATPLVQIPQVPPLVSSSAAPPPQPPKSGMVNEGDSASVWQAFVAFVGKEKKFLASHLESAVALELPPGPLKIGVGERHNMSFLQDSDNSATLKQLAKRFFTDDVGVQITSMATDGASKLADQNGPGAARVGDERSEMVKEALRIFGGSIRNVRKENG